MLHFSGHAFGLYNEKHEALFLNSLIGLMLECSNLDGCRLCGGNFHCGKCEKVMGY